MFNFASHYSDIVQSALTYTHVERDGETPKIVCSFGRSHGTSMEMRDKDNVVRVIIYFIKLWL